MQKYIITLFILCAITSSYSQIPTNRNFGNTSGLNSSRNDSLNKKFVNVQLSGKTHYTDYKIISYSNDTTYIDTTLTIKKEYKFNYLRKDDFELLPLHNQGQPFNRLGYEFTEPLLFPKMGARAKFFNFYEVKDIDYYEVPTPTTELFYRTGLEQGQILDALFTFNTTKRHNTSIAYKGLRSLGKYRNSLSSHGNLRMTFSYITKNSRYHLRSHIVAQDLINNENGGLTAESIINFDNKDPNFTDRGRLETNFSTASNVLRGNRYFIQHDFNIWQHIDTLNTIKSYLKLGHTFNYELNHYEYRQPTIESTILGDAFDSSIDDKLTYKTLKNEAFLAMKSTIVLGEVKFKASHLTYNYGYKSATYIDDNYIPPTLKGNTISVGGEWRTMLKKFNIHADAATILTGDFTGNYLKASASYNQDSIFNFKGTFLINSRSPNLNFIINQSDYVNYNWYENLKNERYRTLAFELTSDKILNASVQLSQIDNYTFFSDTTATQTQPFPQQSDKTVNYLKVKISKEFKFGKFALNNTIMYQNVSQGSADFRVPEFVARNTFYYSNYLFKGDPLYLQTGVTFKYFTKYYADSYNPLLAEFTLQNEQKIGGYPILNFFINAQIQRTRLYLKAEHFNSSFSGSNYYSAPLYPYRDFVIRFGVVWDFFI